MTTKSILLLSAFDTPAQVYWREGLVTQFPDYRWQVLTLPPRHAAWRQRGNSLHWAYGREREVLYRPYDVIIATGSVDLSSLRGFLPQLAEIPTLLYCHDNPFAWPRNEYQQSPLDAQLTCLYSALCADKVVFNSAFNRQGFLDGVRRLLAQMPDAVPVGIVELATQRSLVLPVPLQEDCRQAAQVPGTFTVVWNHRRDYEKGPERLLEAVRAVLARKLPVRFHIIGAPSGEEPPEFATIHQLLDKAGALGTFGTVGRVQYQKCLRQSHVALSTALQEFQGLSLMEAVAAGCVPLVPDRLAYPEYYPASCRYPSHLANPEAEALGLASRLAEYHRRWTEKRLDIPREIALPWWADQKPVYRQLIEDLR